jgi:hypothetical protein
MAMNAIYSDVAQDRIRLRDLKNEARKLEYSLADRERPRTYDDEQQILNLRAKADPVYRDAGRLGAPEPMVSESPRAFRIRMLDDLGRYHKDWSKTSVDCIRDETALSHVEQQIFDAARKNGPSYGLKDGEIRQLATKTQGGHTVYNFAGNENTHFTQQFSRGAKKATFYAPEVYHEMSRNNILSRITERIPGYVRGLFGHTRAEI